MRGQRVVGALLAGLLWVIISTPRSTTGSEPAVSSIPLVINEYLADPAGNSAGDLEGDANGDGVRSAAQDEFIELVNAGVAALDIGGFSLSDAAQVRFQFPAGTRVPAGEAVLVFGGGQPSGEFGNARQNGLVFTSSGLNLNNGVDSIVVRDAAGAEIARRDYPAADGSANQSLTRSPDVAGVFLRHSAAPDSQGALFSPGTRVNGEPFTTAPHITRIIPDQVVQSPSPFDLRIEGMNFDGGAIVQVDLQTVATTYTSGSMLTATIPASLASSAGDHLVTVVNPNGTRSNEVTLTIISLPPRLQSLRPHFVELGTGPFMIFLQGEHFIPSSIVLVEDTPVATFFLGSGDLAATIPARFVDTLGSRQVKIRNPDGQMSNTAAFEVIPRRPRLVAISPEQVRVGSPPFSLAVRGANFKASSTVLVHQTPLPTTFVSSTLITAEVPASLLAEVGLKSVTVQDDNGALSEEMALRVVAIPPLLGALSPDSAIEGSSELTIRLSGQGYQRGAIVRVLSGSSLGPALATTVTSTEQLEARLPADLLQTAGNLMLRVENPDFSFSNEVVFRIFLKDPLIINEYLADPPDQTAGDANGDGSRSSSQDEFIEIVNRTSEAIDISGFQLFDGDGLRHIFAVGSSIPAFETAVVFGGGSPQGRFGNATENGLVFTASSGALSLNNGGDDIILKDAQGRTLQEVKFGAREGGANESINRNPDGNGAVFSLHSQVGFGRAFSPGARATGEDFTTKPVIYSLTPASARVRSENVAVTLTGTNFQLGAVVLCGQNVLPTVFHSPATVEVRLDAELLAEGGLISLRVRNLKGELSSPVTFLVTDDPPHLTSITPSLTATGAEDLEITITGQRLQRAARVVLAGEILPTRELEHTGSTRSLVAIAPAKFFREAGELEVSVLNADTNLSNALSLRVDYGPLLTRLSKGKLKAGSGEVEILVSGVAFAADMVLFINDSAVPTRILSDTTCSARIPAPMTEAPNRLTLQARLPNGGRSNRVQIQVIE